MTIEEFYEKLCVGCNAVSLAAITRDVKKVL